MTVTSKASGSGSKPKSKPNAIVDAIDLLTQDHADVQALFEQYEGLSVSVLAVPSIQTSQELP